MAEKARDASDERLVKVWPTVTIFKLFDLIFNINLKFRVLIRKVDGGAGYNSLYVSNTKYEYMSLVTLAVWFYGVIPDRAPPTSLAESRAPEAQRLLP